MSIELALIPIAIALTQTIGTKLGERMNDENSYSLKTIMRDEELLYKALENYGCNASLLDGEKMESTVGNLRLLFQKDEQGTFDLIADQSISAEHSAQFLKQLEEEYTHLVQQQTYLRLLERAKEQGLVLETEEVGGNNSIVLTFKVES